MASRLRQLRLARKMTQQELADAAGLSRQYVARLERAMQEPRLSVLEKLAKALRVKVVLTNVARRHGR
jgi:transcriptional regulator with XRE-family HTH domain